MKSEPDRYGKSHHELIGTLKFAGWIALFVLTVIVIAIVCSK